jgi:hypothetical protein
MVFPRPGADYVAPGKNILRHYIMLLQVYVTHGGINSLHEAIKFRTPIVGIPSHSDNMDNLIREKTSQFKELTLRINNVRN